MANLNQQINNLKIKYLKNPVLTVSLFNEVLDLIGAMVGVDTSGIGGGSTTIVNNSMSATQIRDLLQTLKEKERLDVTAIKGITETIIVNDGTGRDYTLQEMIYHILDTIRDVNVDETYDGDGSRFLNDAGQYEYIDWNDIQNKITKTSQLINDGDGTSKYLTVADQVTILKNAVKMDTSIISGIQIEKIGNSDVKITTGSFVYNNYVSDEIRVENLTTELFVSVGSLNSSKTLAYIGLSVNKTIIIQYEPFSVEDRRTKLPIGFIEYQNMSIIAVNNHRINNKATLHQLHDFIQAIGVVNVSGNKIYPSTNLGLGKQAGWFFGSGINGTDYLKPNNLQSPVQNDIKFTIVDRVGRQLSSTTQLDVRNTMNSESIMSEIPDNHFSFCKISMNINFRWFYEYGDYTDLEMSNVVMNTSVFESCESVSNVSIYSLYVIFRKNILSTSTALLQNELMIVEDSGFGLLKQKLKYQDVIDALEYVPEDVKNKVTNLENPNDTTYPTTKAVVDYIDEVLDESTDDSQQFNFSGQSSMVFQHTIPHKVVAFVYVDVKEIMCDISYDNVNRTVSVNLSEPLTGYILIHRLKTSD